MAPNKVKEVLRMEQRLLSLRDIQPGESAFVRELLVTGRIRRRLLDIGLILNTRVECLGRSPCGDPSAYLIRGAVIALREEDCADILVARIQEEAV